MRLIPPASVLSFTTARLRFVGAALAANVTSMLPQVALAQDTHSALTSDRAVSPSVEQCITASEAALESMSQDLILEARKHAEVCAHAGCPAVIREECSRLNEQWTTLQPRLTFRLLGPTGEDVQDARVTLNGSDVGQPGAPVDVNPGSYTARFEAPGYLSQEQTLVVNKGEGTRLWSATLELAPVEEPPQPPSAVPAAPGAHKTPADVGSSLEDQGTGYSNIEVAGMAIAGVGALGLATGGVFMVLAKMDYDESRQNGCNSRGECTSEKGVTFAEGAQDNATSATPFVIGGGAMVLGGAALVLADTLWSSGESSSASVNFHPVITREVSGLIMAGWF